MPMTTMLDRLRTAYKYVRNGPPKCVFKHPIDRHHIKSIEIKIGKKFLSSDRKIVHAATVSFENEDTSLSQKFEEDSFVGLLQTIDDFVVSHEVAKVLMTDNEGED